MKSKILKRQNLSKTNSEPMQANLNNDIRTKVAKILSIDEDPSWTIETSENLCLVSSKKEMTPRYPDLRGLVVDLNAKQVVVPCFGRITSVLTPMMHFVLTPMMHFDNGKMCFDDADGNQIILEQNNMRFSYGFEGPVLRIYKNAGKLYCSTNRRLDCTKSRWGTKKTFLEMFKELGGEEIFEKAFPSSKNYSSHFLTFIVVHPDMLLCTKQNVGSGYLVFLGASPCFTKESCPYPTEEVDWETYGANKSRYDAPFIVTDMFESAIGSKLPYCPSPLSLDDVNRHLLLGYGNKYANDIRTGSGEFVIAYVKDPSSEREQLYRFVSPSYDHRSRMRNEDPNLLHQFYCLSSEAYLNDAEYEMKYPWLEYEENKKTEAEDGQIMFWNRGKRAVAPDWQKKFRNLWKHFVLAVPLHRQREVFGYYKQFFLNRDILCDWLCSWYGRAQDDKEMEELLSARAKKLMQLALDYERKHNSKADLTLNKKNLEKNMKFLLSNERGSSLYMLWKNRKQHLRHLEMQAQEAKEAQEAQEAEGVKQSGSVVCNGDVCMLREECI